MNRWIGVTRRKAKSLAISVLLAVCAVSGVARADEQSTPVSSPAAVTVPAVMEMTYEKNLLTVRAEGADLATLLKKIAESAGIAIEVGEGVSGKVSVAFTGVSLEDGVKRLLETADSKNYSAEFLKSDLKEGFSLRKISVMRKATGQPAGTSSVASAKKEFRTPESVRAWLKEKYGTEWRVSWRPWVKHSKDFSWVKGKIPGLTPPNTPEEARTMAGKLLPEFIEVLEIPLDQLKYSKTSLDTSLSFDVWYQHRIDNVPVDRSRVIISYHKDTQEICVTNDIKRGIDISTAPELTAEEAVRRADNYFRALTPSDDVKKYEGWGPVLKARPELTILGVPLTSDRPDNLIYHLVWEVKYPAAYYYIDAASGELVQTAVTAVPALETISGRLIGKRYGDFAAGTQGRYTDDFNPHVVGLPHLPIWTLSDPWAQLSGDPTQKTRDDGTYTLTMNCTDPGCSSYLYSRLQTEKFRIYEGSTDTSYLRWDGFFDAYTWEFPDDAPGHQPNLYHQLQRGISWLADNTATGDGVPGNEPPFLPIHAAVPMGANEHGKAYENQKIEFSELGAKTSDYILHELTHAAVFTIRRKYLGLGDSQWGINEGLADYFACTVNKDQYFDGLNQGVPASLDLDLDPSGKELVPEDWTKDKVIDATDWAHYNNGFVFASMLWDLSPGGVEDTKIWQVAEAMDGYEPQEFYDKLQQKADPARLWDAYSKHDMNVQAEVGPSSVKLSWLPYNANAAGITYEVKRSEFIGMAPSDIIGSTGANSLEDKGGAQAPLVPGTTYYYEVEVNGAHPGAARPVGKVEYTGFAAPVVSIADVPFHDAEIYKFKLKWQPEDVSGSPACTGAGKSGYRVLRKKPQDDQWALYPPEASPTTFNSSYPATFQEETIEQPHGVASVYEYRVAAYCDVGMGRTRESTTARSRTW